MIIDGDGHFVEPPDIWATHVDPQFRDRIYFQTDAGDASQTARSWSLGRDRGHTPSGSGRLVERFVVDDVVTTVTSPEMPFTVADTMNPHGILPGRSTHASYEQCHPGGFDPEARLAVHDAEGIDAAVLFPTMGLFVGSIRGADVAAAFARAVNRFAADYCSAAPDELYAVATLPSQDPDLAAAELRRAVEDDGFVAGWIRPNPTREGNRTLDHPSLEVLWSTAEDLGVPLCTHSGTTALEPTAGIDRASTFLLAHALAHPFEAMLAFGSLFQGRVFERHPRLRFGFMEANAGWAPFWIDRLDEHYEIMGWMFDPPLDRRPSEIFREQCYVGCESEEPMVPYVQVRFGDRKVLWASDFPHFDCEMPGLVTPMLERDDLTPNGRAGALETGALEFYGLDRTRIQDAAGRRRGET